MSVQILNVQSHEGYKAQVESVVLAAQEQGWAEPDGQTMVIENVIETISAKAEELEVLPPAPEVKPD